MNAQMCSWKRADYGLPSSVFWGYGSGLIEDERAYDVPAEDEIGVDPTCTTTVRQRHRAPLVRGAHIGLRSEVSGQAMTCSFRYAAFAARTTNRV